VLQEGLNMVVKTGHTSLLLSDALRRPLAEVELGAVQASVRRPTDAVMQVCYFRSADSYFRCMHVLAG